MTRRESFEKFKGWYQDRFGHDFGGVSDEDCDLENCWQLAQAALIADIVEKLEKFSNESIHPVLKLGVDSAIEIVRKAGE